MIDGQLGRQSDQPKQRADLSQFLLRIRRRFCHCCLLWRRMWIRMVCYPGITGRYLPRYDTGTWYPVELSSFDVSLPCPT